MMFTHAIDIVLEWITIKHLGDADGERVQTMRVVYCGCLLAHMHVYKYLMRCHLGEHHTATDIGRVQRRIAILRRRCSGFIDAIVYLIDVAVLQGRRWMSNIC